MFDISQINFVNLWRWMFMVTVASLLARLTPCSNKLQMIASQHRLKFVKNVVLDMSHIPCEHYNNFKFAKETFRKM